MKKWWMLFGGCLSFLLTGKAAAVEDSLLDVAHNRSLLWKVTGNDMKKPSYIFGTMHLICKDDYVWTPAMKKSLKAVKEVCFEMDLDDPKLLMQIANGMTDESGKQLKDYFTAEDYELVRQFFSDSLGIDLSMMAQLKPAALITVLATSGSNCSQTVSYENNIMTEAQRAKIAITGLEQPWEQLALLNAIPVDTFIHEILEMVKGKNPGTSDYDELVKAYRSQNIAKLYYLIASSDANRIGLDAFLDERNEKWIERMEERMDQQPVFFAVGAGHLWGSKGVLNLLRNKGYNVQPVK